MSILWKSPALAISVYFLELEKVFRFPFFNLYHHPHITHTSMLLCRGTKADNSKLNKATIINGEYPVFLIASPGSKV